MAQVTGIVYVKVDGQLLRSNEGASLELGGKSREPRVGNRLYGFSEKVVPAKCEFTLAHVGGDDLIGLQDKVDGTLEFETDTGDSYLMANSFCTQPAKISGGSGEVPFIFVGEPAEKI